MTASVWGALDLSPSVLHRSAWIDRRPILAPTQYLRCAGFLHSLWTHTSTGLLSAGASLMAPLSNRQRQTSRQRLIKHIGTTCTCRRALPHRLQSHVLNARTSQSHSIVAEQHAEVAWLFGSCTHARIMQPRLKVGGVPVLWNVFTLVPHVLPSSISVQLQLSDVDHARADCVFRARAVSSSAA